MLGRKAIGMFVKVDGVEVLQKDMQEEFIINSVLSWKICKRTYNKLGDFFIINSSFPSPGWYYSIAQRPSARGCQRRSEFTTKRIVFIKKKKKSKKIKIKKQPPKNPGQ